MATGETTVDSIEGPCDTLQLGYLWNTSFHSQIQLHLDKFIQVVTNSNWTKVVFRGFLLLNSLFEGNPSREITSLTPLYDPHFLQTNFSNFPFQVAHQKSSGVQVDVQMASASSFFCSMSWMPFWALTTYKWRDRWMLRIWELMEKSDNVDVHKAGRWWCWFQAMCFTFPNDLERKNHLKPPHSIIGTRQGATIP